MPARTDHDTVAPKEISPPDRTAPPDREALLVDVARQGRRLLGAPVAQVVLVSEEGPAITVRAVDGPGRQLRIPGDHPSVSALLAGTALWSAADDPGAAAGPPGAAVTAVRLGQVHGSTPLRFTTALYLVDRRLRELTCGERAQLLSFARLAGAATEQTQLLDLAVARLYGLEQQSARAAADVVRLQALRSVHYGFIDLAVARGDVQAFVDETDRRLGAGPVGAPSRCAVRPAPGWSRSPTTAGSGWSRCWPGTGGWAACWWRRRARCARPPANSCS
jgi:hypothetical protein